MAKTPIGGTVAAGNASYATLYTAPVGTDTLIGGLVAYNSTGGSLTLTVAIVEVDGTVSVVKVDSIGAGATASYSSSSSTAICPIILKAGSSIQAKGSSAGISCRYSGLEFTS